jgi:hypothetical protein
MSESMFDAEKNYYVFKYVVDHKGEPTEHEGEIQGFVVATDPWEACTKAGFDDMNEYGANVMEDPKKTAGAIATERKHLSKISKQLKPMIDKIDEDRKKVLDDNECPNGCGKMDKKQRCKKCGFGFEGEKMLKDIERVIKEEKKAGNDTSQLEAVRDALKEELEN